MTRQRLEKNRAALVDRFADTAKLRNWNLFRTASAEAAVGYVVELCRSLGAEQVARSDQPVFANLSVDAALRGAGHPIHNHSAR